MSGSRTGRLDVSGGKGSSGLQLSEIEAGDGGTRMPILSSSGSGYARTASNWVERLTFFLLLFVGVGVVVIIGVTSSNNKALETAADSLNKLNAIQAANAALGIPGYESYSWNDVLKASIGSTVNLFGQSNLALPTWIKATAAPDILAKYGIILNVNPTTIGTVTTSIAANAGTILDHVEADITSGATCSASYQCVDMVWTNGANFLRASTGVGSSISPFKPYVYGPWANKVPSAANFDWTSTSIAYDFGYPTAGYEMPVFSANWNLIYRTDIISSAPTTFMGLTAMLQPDGALYQKFTYAVPGSTGNYIEAAFIRHFLYENCYTKLSSVSANTQQSYLSATTCKNDYAQYIGQFNPTLYDANVGNAFQQLRILESGIVSNSIPSTKNNLYKGIYCDSNTHCAALFKAGKIYAYMAYSATTAGGACAASSSTNYPAGASSWSDASTASYSATITAANLAGVVSTTQVLSAAAVQGVSTLTLAVTGLVVGMAVSGTGIAPGAYISAIGTSSITISIETQSAISAGVSISFTAYTLTANSQPSFLGIYNKPSSGTGVPFLFANGLNSSGLNDNVAYVTYVSTTSPYLIYLSRHAASATSNPTSGTYNFESPAAQPCGTISLDPASCPAAITGYAGATINSGTSINFLTTSSTAKPVVGMTLSAGTGNTDNYPIYTTITSVGTVSGTGPYTWPLTLSTAVTIQTASSTAPLLLSMHCTAAYVPTGSGALANNNFLSIMSNSANKLASIVVGNYIASIQMQFNRRSNDGTTSKRWIGAYSITSDAYVNQGWDAAFNYLVKNVNYPQTPAVQYLRPPSSLPEIDARYQTRMNADWYSCVYNYGSSTASGNAVCATP